MKLKNGLQPTSARRSLTGIIAWLVFALLFSAQVQAQFAVSAIPHHELCPGDASLTLSAINAEPNIPVVFKVYKLPNTSVPVFNSTGTTVTGLNDGTYLVVAVQVVNGNPVQTSTEVVIEDQTIPLEYDIESDNALCGPDGSITVIVTSGNAVSYEIIAGPVTRVPQTSNLFSNIPAGTYSVRVTDNCGTGIVVTEVVQTDGATLEIGPATFPDIQLPACDLITLTHNITTTESWMVAQVPLTATITLYPPGGGDPIVYTQSIPGLSEGGPEVMQVIPFYYDTTYYYDLEIVDACGTVYTVENNLVHQTINIQGGYGDAGCPGKFLQITLFKYVAPYTIVFNSWPEDFDPVAVNPAHPGPFVENVTNYGSEEDDIAVPYGVYNFTVTDACGRTRTIEVEIEEPEEDPEPQITTYPTNCLEPMGGVEILITGFELVSAEFTAAPDDYGTVPSDVSEYITPEHRLTMENMLPEGDYSVTLVDECGRIYEETFTVGSQGISTISGNVRVDCTPGFGTIRISSSTTISEVIITQAPAAAGLTLPYNATSNVEPVDGGDFFMNNMPPGSYKFSVDDECNTDYEVQKVITGYNTTNDEFTVTRHCGSFDVLLEHTTTASVFIVYALQKEISPGQWGHPGTGILYSWGDTPTGVNSILVTPGTPIYALPYTGNFRVVKCFSTYGTGRADDTIEADYKCIEILHEFDFFDDLQLISIVSLTCSGDIADVQVNVQGAEPINFRIIEKNGEPFVIENGENNIFTGLESAEYVVFFEDPCGNFITQPFNVADLPSAVSATAPADMELCDTDGNGTETFDLSSQNAAVLDGQSPLDFTVTYHASQEEADSGDNPLPLNYACATSTLYARVLNNLNTACHATAFFEVVVHPKPVIDMDDSYSICEGEDVTIYAPEGFARYIWNGVELPRVITVNEGGTITLEVIDDYGCSATKNLVVTASQAPHIATINIDDWTDVNNTITVVVEDSPSAAFFEYSLDGVNYQGSNVFTGLTPGHYTVYVRDIYDCGMDQGEVYLLTYPRFFTPNGDGINDTWRIQFSHMEPDMITYIYDRFGKLLTSFDTNNLGWDGTYNGHRLPATDYWFVVKRQNGKEYKGHFSMMR